MLLRVAVHLSSTSPWQVVPPGAAGLPPDRPSGQPLPHPALTCASRGPPRTSHQFRVGAEPEAALSCPCRASRSARCFLPPFLPAL